MAPLTTGNYFDQVKKVNFSKVPGALSKTHDLVNRVGTGSEAWVNYNESAQIRSTIDKHFELMGKYLGAHPELQVKAAPVPKAPKPAAAPKAAKPAKATAPAVKLKGGDRVAFQHDGKTVYGLVQPYTGGKARITNGVVEVHVDALNRTLDLPVASVKLHKGPAPKTAKPAAPKAAKPAKAKKVKAPKAPKAAKPAKVKPVDTRAEVPQLSGEVLLMQAFLKIEGKPASIDQIRALHRRMEKDFTKHKVRSTSKHADVLRGIAGTVAALYAKMTDKQIGSIAKLEFKSSDTKQLAEKAKAIVGGVRVGTATTLLSAFVNMEGTVPTEKAVANLRTKLENEFEEHPDGDFALAVGAAAAVLKDWRAGKSVRITKQQLSGLAGLMDLGCPDPPLGKGCGCSAAPKKARR